MKTAIAIHMGTDVTQFRLYMGETYLNDTAPLTEKGVTDGCLLRVSPKSHKRKQLDSIEGKVKDTDKPN